MLKAVIFDFDGVLGDTFEKSIGICKSLGIDFTMDDFLDHHNGNVFDKPKISFTEESANDFFSIYERMADAKRLFPLKDELEKIKKIAKLFVLSSNKESAIKKYFNLAGWDMFENIYGMDTDKSKIKKFKIIFGRYSLKPEECVFITDTLGDLLEGDKVGVKSLAVTWGYHNKERLEKGNPDGFIDNFNDLSNKIKEISL